MGPGCRENSRWFAGGISRHSVAIWIGTCPNRYGFSESDFPHWQLTDLGLGFRGLLVFVEYRISIRAPRYGCVRVGRRRVGDLVFELLGYGDYRRP